MILDTSGVARLASPRGRQLAALAVLLLVGAAFAIAGFARSVASVHQVAAGIMNTESRRLPASDGSVVLLNGDTVAKIVEILGIRGGIAGPDSIMVYTAVMRRDVRLDSLGRDQALIGMIEPVWDWALPITIRLQLVRLTSDTALRHGRLGFHESQVSLPVYTIPSMRPHD